MVAYVPEMCVSWDDIHIVKSPNGHQIIRLYSGPSAWIGPLEVPVEADVDPWLKDNKDSIESYRKRDQGDQ
jgi:hypothetical protein